MPNKKAFIAILIGVGLALAAGRFYFVSVESDQQLQAVISTVTAESGLLRSPVQELDFYRQLSIGDSFTLQLGTGNSDAITEVVVTHIAREGVIASVVGSLSANGSLLMTLGDKFMHIFLASENGIYEFSGKEFQGVVERTKDMRFENDTAVLSNQSVELKDQPVRRVIELPVIIK